MYRIVRLSEGKPWVHHSLIRQRPHLLACTDVLGGLRRGKVIKFDAPLPRHHLHHSPSALDPKRKHVQPPQTTRGPEFTTATRWRPFTLKVLLSFLRCEPCVQQIREGHIHRLALCAPLHPPPTPGLWPAADHSILQPLLPATMVSSGAINQLMLRCTWTWSIIRLRSIPAATGSFWQSSEGRKKKKRNDICLQISTPLLISSQLTLVLSSFHFHQGLDFRRAMKSLGFSAAVFISTRRCWRTDPGAG